MTHLEAVADPVRLAVARHLGEALGASASEVADGVGIHLNTARAHLAALVDAGVAERVSESAGRRGRPVVRYRLSEGWVPRGDELLSLASLLASAVLRVEADPAELRSVGREWGRRWVAAGDARPVEAQLSEALRRLGFEARVVDERLVLSACPCPLVAPDRPALVCSLADGVVDGVLDGSSRAAGRRSHDPRSRRCSSVLEAA
jgi:predicted ArsR family transcriptional regulator